MSEDKPKYSPDDSREDSPRKIVTIDDLLVSNMLEIYALILILIKKGITSEFLK